MSSYLDRTPDEIVAARRSVQRDASDYKKEVMGDREASRAESESAPTDATDSSLGGAALKWQDAETGAPVETTPEEDRAVDTIMRDYNRQFEPPVEPEDNSDPDNLFPGVG